MNISSIRYKGSSNFICSMIEKEKINSSWAKSILSFPFSITYEASNQLAERCKYEFARCHTVKNEIKNMASKLGKNADLTRNQKQILIDALNSPEYKFLKYDIARIFERASCQSIRSLLKNAVKKGLLADDPVFNLRGFDCVTSLRRMAAVLDSNEKDITKGMEEEASLQSDRVFKDPRIDTLTMVHSVLNEACRLLLNVVDAVVMVSGKIGTTLFGSSIKIKGHKDLDTMATPIKLVLCFIVLNYVTCHTAIGAEILAEYALIASGVAVLGYSLLALAAAFPVLYWLSCRFSPCPNSFAHGKNLVQEAKDGKIGFVAARDHEINRFIECLEENKHVHLRGNAGAGKRGIIRGVAKRMAMGGGHVPECLRGKKLFSLDMKELAKNREKLSKVLKEFCKNFKGHEDEVVVFLDQADVAFDELHQILSQFPLVVLSSSRSIDHHEGMGLIRRFSLLETDQEKTVTILQEYALKEAPHLHFDEKVLNYIYKASQDLFPGSVQPGKALMLLAEVISSDLPIGDRNTRRRIKELEEDKQNMRLEHYHIIPHAGASFYRAGAVKDLEGIDNELRKLYQSLEKQKKKVERLWKIRSLRASLVNAKLEAAFNVVDLQSSSGKQHRKNWMIIKEMINEVFPRIIRKLEKEVKDLTVPI